MSDSSKDEDFAALLAESEGLERRTRRIAVGDVVRGRVVAIGASTAFVAVGGKSEAVIELAEFRDPETDEVRIGVGDEIEATVTDDGSRSGSIVLKQTLGRGSHLPGELEDAMAHGIAVEGLVTGENKGGFDVQVAGRRAFCPASQIDVRRGVPGDYVGQRLHFRIRRIDGHGRNIVLSRRELLEEEQAARAAKTRELLAVGAVMKGKVTSLRDFGAFVDLGGIEGLIHVSELGHGRIANPADVLEVGQTVEAQVVRIEPATEGSRERIALSLRALAADPWDTVASRYAVGTATLGKVVRVEPFGAFVELEPGVEGLVHVSRMALDRRISNAKQAVQVGDEVRVSVIGVEESERRIALSMVEAARQDRESAEREAVALAKSVERKSLGTIGDLLAKSRKSKE